MNAAAYAAGRKYGRVSAVAQGLPPTVEDSDALAAIAEALRMAPPLPACDRPTSQERAA